MNDSQNQNKWLKFNGKRIGSSSSAHKGIPLTKYTNPIGETYEIREHVYVDIGKTQQPYGIAFIHAFKEKKDGIYMDVRWYYRFSDLSIDLQTTTHPDLAEFNIEYLPNTCNSRSLDTLSTAGTVSDNKSDNLKLIRLKTRELFASEFLDSCLACHITGRCCIVSYRTINEAQEFRAFPNTFYYLFTYNPQLRRLASTQGEIRIGSQYQAIIPDFEGTFCCNADNEPVTITTNTKTSRKYLKCTEREEVQWSVELANQLSNLDVMTFLQAVKSIAAFSTMCEETNNNVVQNAAAVTTDLSTQRDYITQRAYDAIHEAHYDLKEALEIITKSSLTDTIKRQWSEEDKKKFQRAIRQLGKNFYRIQRECLPDKTVAEVVAYYYSWKKTTTGLIMRPKRRMKPVLQRRVKNATINNSQIPTSLDNEADSVPLIDESVTNGDEDVLSTNNSQSANICVHCDCHSEEPLNTISLSTDDDKQCCLACFKYFKRYGQLPSIDIPIASFDEIPLEGRLKEAIMSFRLREQQHPESLHSKDDKSMKDELNGTHPPNTEANCNVEFEKESIRSLSNEIKSECIVGIPEICTDMILERDSYKLVRVWHRTEENSCSRTDIIFSKKLESKPKSNSLIEKPLKRTSDLKPTMSHSDTHMKEEKRIKNEKPFDRYSSKPSITANCSSTPFMPYNSPTLNKLFSVAASANNPYMFQHHPSFSPIMQHHYPQLNGQNSAAINPSTSSQSFPMHLTADTPALRQLRDIASVRCNPTTLSNSNINPSLLNSIYNNPTNNASAALALQQFMATLNSGGNTAISPSNLPFLLNNQLSGSPMLPINSTCASQRQTDCLAEQSRISSGSRRISPLSGSSVKGDMHQNSSGQPSTHNHAHLHAHSHTHLHLNDNVTAHSGQSHPHTNHHNQPIISPHSNNAPVSQASTNPFLILPPNFQNSLYYHQLMNHSGSANNSPMNNDSEPNNLLLSAAQQIPNHNSLDLIQVMGYGQPGQTNALQTQVANPFLFSNGNHLNFQPSFLPNIGPTSLQQASPNLVAAAAASQQHQQALMAMMRGGMSHDYMLQYQQALQHQLFLHAAASAASRQCAHQFMPYTAQSPLSNTRIMDLKPNTKEDMSSLNGARINTDSRNGRSSSTTPGSNIHTACNAVPVQAAKSKSAVQQVNQQFDNIHSTTKDTND